MYRPTQILGLDSTPMPTVPLSLGKYVTVRTRADGSSRVLFEVPARLRPDGWPATTPLPLEGRGGDLNDPAELARIRADADTLHAQLLQARMGAAAPDGRTFDVLVKSWRRTDEYRDLRPRTQAGYEESVKRILAWSAGLGDPDPARMGQQGVREFLGLLDETPWVKWHARKVLRLVMNHAIGLGWRPDNPVQGIRVRMPKSTVAIWEPEHVDAYAWAAVAMGQPAVAAAILTEWEIGQRLTDLILFRRAVTREGARLPTTAGAPEYEPVEGVFRFWQSKTRSYVTIPVSARLRAVLAICAVPGSPYLFHDGATGRPFPDVGRLGHVFEQVRDLALGALADEGEDDERHSEWRVLRALRHSCVVQLARAGCTVPEIASITGHSIGTIEAILSVYLPRDNVVAWNAQVKRGLINA